MKKNKDGLRRGEYRRFLNHHHIGHVRGFPVPATADLSDKWEARYTPEPNTGCWLWLGYINPKGYGKFSVSTTKTVFAHRFGWELVNGPVPDGLVLDHICRERGCVNPAHLRLVTIRTNVLENSVGIAATNRAKTHCHRGHEFTPENTYDPPTRRGQRICKACRNERSRAYSARHRAA